MRKPREQALRQPPGHCCVPQRLCSEHSRQLPSPPPASSLGSWDCEEDFVITSFVGRRLREDHPLPALAPGDASDPRWGEGDTLVSCKKLELQVHTTTSDKTV